MTNDATPGRAEADPADAVIAAYLEALQAGTPPDRVAVLARHPELAGELVAFFDDLDGFAALAAPLRQASTGADVLATPAPGTMLTDVPAAGRTFGDYELLGEVARGAMGVVYRARQRSLNRTVAVKMVLAGAFASQEEVGRFRREAESAAGLDHSNIVPIYEVGEHDGHHFYSMKLIEGGSLARLREPGGRVTPREAARLVAAAARAVHYAHQRGVLHRDLKPANILLDPAGQPLVTDFGLAKRVAGGDSATQPGAVVGTPAYMAPEQVDPKGKPLTTAADVYGLGAVLYELLTGQAPFQAPTVFDTLARVLHDPPVPPSRLAAGVPRDLNTVCVKCLEKDPARRYQSAAELADDLEHWLRGEPVKARRAGRVERALKWVRRRPAAAALVAVSTAALVLLLVGPAIGFVVVGAAYQSERDARTDLDRSYRREQLSSYHTKVAFAGREQQAGRWENADRLLDECPDELRRWEWHYLKRVCRVQKTWRVPGVSFYNVAFHPDGRHLAMIQADQALVVFDAATGEQRPLPVPCRGQVHKLLFSGDGRSLGLLSDAGDEPALLLCDAETGALRLSLPPSAGRVRDAQSSRDGSRVMARDDSAVKVWDTGTGQLIRQFDGRPLNFSYEASLSPDGRRVFRRYFKESEGVIWDVASGKEIARPGDLHGLGDFSFTPDGEHYLFKPADERMALWDLTAGRESWRCATARPGFFEHSHWVTSPGGGRIAVVASWLTSSPTSMHDARTGQVLYSIPGADIQVAFGPDDKLVVAAGTGGLHLLDLATGRPRLTLLDAMSDEATGLGFSPDGQALTAVTRLPGRPAGVEMRHWDLRLASGATTFEGSFAVAFSPDSRRLAYAGGPRVVDKGGDELPFPVYQDVKVIDLATGAELLCLKDREPAVFVIRIAFSGDGSRIVTGDDSGGMRVWDARTGQEVFASKKGWCAVFSPDSERVIAVADKGVKVWEATTGRELLTFGDVALEAPLAISPDGSLIATQQETGEVVLWDAKTGERRREVCKLQTRSELPLNQMAFTPDGTALAVADGTLGLWDVETGKEVGRIGCPVDTFGGLTLSPDGRRLVVVPRGGRLMPTALKVFDVATGREVASLPGHGSVVPTVVFSRDGNRIASASLTEVRVWDGTPLDGTDAAHR
jgi:WD40 repeat protein